MTLTALLEAAGANIRGRRADCPECGGRQTVAVDAERGLYCCHKFGCGFRGSAATLSRLIGGPNVLEMRRERDAKTAKTHSHVDQHKHAALIWDETRPALPTHPYLTRKCIRPHGVRRRGDALCLAGFDMSGRIRTLQFIAPDGAKRFLRGSGSKGCMFPIDGAGQLLPGRLWVAEGFATAATVCEATGEPAVCALSAGNLLPVCLALRTAWPHLELVIAADNDHATSANPGITAARAAARAANIGRGLCRAVWPCFEALDCGTDWNDFACRWGVGAVRTALREAGICT